jgi:D-glycero-alpha-D-manno-heptose-7-phosphate kinase
MVAAHSRAAGVVRSRVPLRISFGGGGTDVDPYASRHGGATLNATVARYVYCSVMPNDGGDIQVEVTHWERLAAGQEARPLSDRRLAEAVVARINPGWKSGVHVSLRTEAPPGSGLGSSSALVVACIMSLARFLGVVLTPYQVADLAYRIERHDLGISGGYQDQYAAAYGGFNWTLYSGEGVKVYPLSLRPSVLRELELRLMLWHTGDTHLSGGILREQIRLYEDRQHVTLKRLHRMKALARLMRGALERGELDRFGRLLDASWREKRELAGNITNPQIDRLYETALRAGALGGKVIGAGGGGYLLFYVPESSRAQVIEALASDGGIYGGSVYFDLTGPITWTSDSFVPHIPAFMV